MFSLKDLINTVDRWMAAITFAQADESETALDILHDKPERKKQQRTEIRTPRREEQRPELRL
ncbi:MAG: hypothetical protein JRI92_04715 [Deltaproteobacteria bacterium]|nr:hypothetical protein [Deltaproteobacteria bacterium]MBW1821059.1 hypothetical protein [Deltaproteobacteria bacterium]